MKDEFRKINKKTVNPLENQGGSPYVPHRGVMMERETGIEPATSGLGSRRSTAELLPHKLLCDYTTIN